MNATEYVYLRSKNVFLNEDKELELFVFAGLTINTKTVEATLRKKHIENVVSKVLEFGIQEAPSVLAEMDNVDTRVVIDQEVFNSLREQAEHDVLAFCTFDPSNY